MDARLYARVKSSDRAAGFGEPLSKFDFELCDLVLWGCDPGQDVTGQQPQCEPVRVVNNDRVVDCQAH